MRSSTLLAILPLCLVQLTIRANDIEPTKEFYTVPFASKPIVLDGDLSEWSGVPVLADPKFYITTGKEGTPAGKGSGGVGADLVLFEQYQGGTWTGPDDQTSAVQIVYDADNVYFGFVVTDDYHEDISGNAWNGDSIQLMIADSTRTQQIALYNYALGGYEDATGNLVTNDPAGVSYGGVIANHQAGPQCVTDGTCLTEAVITRNHVTHKTTYEIKLPKEALGLTTLKGGPQFGLGMAINDGDGALVDSVQYGQAGQEGQKGWGGLGAHSIVFGKTPQETALVTLAKGNDIEPGKEFYTALRTTNTIVVDGKLTEWTGAPVLADPKFYIATGKEGTPAGKGSGGVGADLVLFEQYQGGTWTGPDDQTSAVQIVYDADNVYFGFVVTDDYHEDISGNAWNGDSIQLMIADAARTNQVALYNYALGGYENATGTLVTDDPAGVSYGGVIVNHQAGPQCITDGTCLTEAVVTRDFANKKTIYEIKLPVGALGLTGPLTVGTQFGLGMAINDGDGALVDGVQNGQAGQEGQKGWGGLGAHSIVFGKTPQETALVTLGTAVSGSDRLFLSAINPAILTFSFRATDKGLSIVNPASAKLTIDGQTVTLAASPKVVDATDFTYNHVTPFAPGNHTYSISVSDSLGNVVTDSGSFVAATVPILTAAQQAVSVDKSKPGFIWLVFQNETVTPATLADAELALAGQLPDGAGGVLPNLADPAAVGIASGPGTVDGPLVKFEIPTVINLSQLAGDLNGAFTPDDQMPGIPGANGLDDGIDAEILTFVEFPAGLVTMGVTSDDGFRTQAGYINKPADGLLLGQFEGVSTTLYKVFVQDPGVYGLRTIYQEVGGGANIEWFTVKADGTTVLLNDSVNGGLKAYRVGVAPDKGAPPPPSLSLAIQLSGGQIKINWTDTAAVLQESTDFKTWTDLPAAKSPYTPTPGTRTAVFYRLKK